MSLRLRFPLINTQRQFSTTLLALAKKKKGGKEAKEPSSHQNAEQLDELDPSQLLKDLTENCSNSIKTFEQRLATLKMGRSNPNIFDKLSVKLDSHDATFPEVAITTVKTPTFLTVTVFDPAHTKRVVSSILGAGINLNPEVDANNPQLLKIKIPNTTKEMKEKTIKEMKQLLDAFKSNANQKDSLINYRSKAMKEVKNLEGAKDVIKKLNNDVDSIYKKYSDKLTDAFKAAEKQVK